LSDTVLLKKRIAGQLCDGDFRQIILFSGCLYELSIKQFFQNL